MSVSKLNDTSLFKRLSLRYVQLLFQKPILTNACTSALAAFIGSATLELQSTESGKTLNWRKVFSYVATGFIYVGPVLQHLYRILDEAIPDESKYGNLKKLLLERIVFMPLFIVGYLYLYHLLEHNNTAYAFNKLKQRYLATVIKHWKLFTIWQYININYVPPQFRALFSNLIGLFYVYYATQQRS